MTDYGDNDCNVYDNDCNIDGVGNFQPLNADAVFDQFPAGRAAFDHLFAGNTYVDQSLAGNDADNLSSATRCGARQCGTKTLNLLPY